MTGSADRRPRREEQPEQQDNREEPLDLTVSPAERAIRQALRDGQFANLQGEGQPAHTREPVRLSNFDSLVEQRIQQAMDDGLFENLPGSGKPLNLDDDLYVPDDMKMAYRLMKAQGLKPPWLEYLKDWKSESAQYEAWREGMRARWEHLTPERRAQARNELRLRVDALNSLIHNINAMVPSDSLRVGLMVYEHELRLLSGAS